MPGRHHRVPRPSRRVPPPRATRASTGPVMHSTATRPSLEPKTNTDTGRHATRRPSGEGSTGERPGTEHPAKRRNPVSANAFVGPKEVGKVTNGVVSPL